MINKNLLSAEKRLGLKKNYVKKIINEPTTLYKSGMRYGVVNPKMVYKSGVK